MPPRVSPHWTRERGQQWAHWDIVAKTMHFPPHVPDRGVGAERVVCGLNRGRALPLSPQFPVECRHNIPTWPNQQHILPVSNSISLLILFDYYAYSTKENVETKGLTRENSHRS